MQTTQHLTLQTVATNFADSILRSNKNDTLVAVRKQLRDTGPFMVDSTLHCPRYVLTETDCFQAYNQTNIHVSLEQFELGCRTTTTPSLIQKGGQQGPMTTVPSLYNLSVATKMVHLIQSPVDFLIERMDQDVKNMKHKTMSRRAPALVAEEDLAMYNDTTDGLLSWCSHVDSKFDSLHASESLPLFSAGQGQDHYRQLPPCYSELYRYVQFHNRATELTRKLHIPSLIAHYDDFLLNSTPRKQQEESIDELLYFLEMTPPATTTGADRPFYYAFAERKRTKRRARRTVFSSNGSLYPRGSLQLLASFIRSGATPICWEQLHRYM